MGLFGASEERVEQVERNVRNSFSRVKRDTEVLSQWVSYLNNQQQEILRKIEGLDRKFSDVPVSKDEIREMIDSASDYDEIRRIVKRIRDRIEGLISYDRRISRVEDQVEELKRLPRRIDSLRESIGDMEHLSDRVDRVEKRVEEVQELPRKLGDIREEVQELKDKSVEPKREPAQTPEKQHEKGSEGSGFEEKVLRKLSRHGKEYTKGFIMDMLNKYDKMSGPQLREIVVEEQGLCSKSSFYRMLNELENEGKVEVVSEGRANVYFPRGVKVSEQNK